MIGAFVYLIGCSLRNRIRVRLRRLRQPRYLAGSVAGALYLYAVVFRRATRAGRAAPTPLALFQRVSSGLSIAGALGLFAVALGAWFIPNLGRGIEFTRAETQFLLQAPVTRRQLVHYKLLRGQVGVFFASAITTILLRPTSFLSGWTFLTGMWVLLAVVRLHLTGVSLRRASVVQHGRRGLEREWLPLLVLSSATIVLVGTLAADWRTLAALQNGSSVFAEVGRLVTTGAARWVLLPFLALARLPLSSTGTQFFRELPAALLLVALNYVWVLRADEAVEAADFADAADRAAERKARAPRVRGLKTSPFHLAAGGPPETAIVWKNLILLGRFASTRSLLRLLPLTVLALVVLRRSPSGVAGSVGILSLFAIGMTILLGPQLMRNDLRQDLANLALLKSWPVRGVALVRGEILAPALVLSCISWLLIGIAALLHPTATPAAAAGRMMVRHPIALGVSAAALAPAAILTQLVVQNALAIMLPAWMATSHGQSRGIDAMGHRLLMLAGVVLALVLALLPAGIAAGMVAFAVHAVAPTAEMALVVLPPLAGAAIVLAECWVAMIALGYLFERTDVSAMDAVE